MGELLAKMASTFFPSYMSAPLQSNFDITPHQEVRFFSSPCESDLAL